MAISEKDDRLLKALKALPYSENEAVANQRENMIICIIMLTGQFRKHEEVMKIIADNSESRFEDVSQIILESDLFPPLEVVGEEEGDRSFYDTRERSEYVVAVDFDGTLCKSKYPECGEPIRKNVQRVRELKRDGATIILWTCREGEALAKAVKWCEEHNVPIDYVNENVPSRIARYGGDCRKISADLYIDDKAD